MSDDDRLLFMIEGQPYDIADLTLDEADEIEEMCGGVPLEELRFGRSKVLKAFAYILRKRDDPDVTIEQIGAIRRQSLFDQNGNTAAGPD